jgi:hypothetical protein
LRSLEHKISMTDRGQKRCVRAVPEGKRPQHLPSGFSANASSDPLVICPAIRNLHHSPSTTRESVASVRDAFFPTDRLRWPVLSGPSMEVVGSAKGLSVADDGVVMSLSALIAQALFPARRSRRWACIYGRYLSVRGMWLLGESPGSKRDTSGPRSCLL